ncbi:hypothetical protein SAMN02745857_02373 [Andreprevotia lacus DSM 23236]|jgi:hypothetical protein|uniref:Uncharacterized protein n=1 Tax=Andreprevotia lacus DSM 23236 TaxID=1121001 RepID=A0A1W1XQ79_9NEIS|nr:hypothetical protein [Andreprevotia lacus]SMC26150.1 hypothetical protein SAMN02745857_02373 [Andreprevotia lacus DSM 23236]
MLRLIWRIALSVGRIVLALLLCLAALLAWRYWPRADAFYLTQADLADRNYLQTRARLLDQAGGGTAGFDLSRAYSSVFAHRITSGQRWVIGYRQYQAGSPLWTDSAGFRKLTIVVPPLKFGSVQTLPAGPLLLAIETSGGSAWPHDACSFQLASGQVVLDARSRRLKVAIRGEMSAARSVHDSDCGVTHPINEQFIASPISLTELTPWLGKAGKYPYDESYRH